MNTNKIKEILKEIAKSSLTAVPYGGKIISQILADKETKEIKDILQGIQSLSQKEISELKIANEELEKIKGEIEKILEEKHSKSKITVIIPVGGDGGSLFPITSVMPKCLVTVGHKSMLQHIIDSFCSYKDIFKRIIVITGKYSDAIIENVRQGSYEDFVECKKMDAPTLPAAIKELKYEIGEAPFLLHYNDVLIEDINWGLVYNRYVENSKRPKHIGMLLCSRYYPIGIGVIHEGDYEVLETFEEKPQYLVGVALANLAVAIFEPEFLTFIEKDHKGIFESTIQKVIDSKEIITLHKVGKWHHVQDLKALYNLQHNTDLKFLTKC